VWNRDRARPVSTGFLVFLENLYLLKVAKFKDTYRTDSIRASWWDYGRPAAYYVTICSRGRVCYFGDVQHKKAVLSRTGVLAEVLWNEIPLHRQGVSLGPYVIMPNHIHGIVILEPEIFPSDTDDSDPTDHKVETGRALSLSKTSNDDTDSDETPGQGRFQDIGKNTLSSIVGAYKSAVTKHANRLGLEHGWQAKFYDRIIRSDTEYQRISTYIETNPAHWSEDEFFIE
jgi:REP element-mobilizing transposase RayT